MSYFEHDDAIRSMIRRARLLSVNDSGSQQLVDLMGVVGDKPKKVFRPQPHGFTSTPPVNSEGLILALGGRSNRPVYLDGGHKDHRPRDIAQGGCALYDANGKVLKFVKDETDFDAGGKPVTIRNATKVKIEGTEAVAVGVGARWIVVKNGKVFLGMNSADDTDGAAVVTVDGPSSKVFAKV